jgi:transcriptional regulator with XRE-family HTH domain
VKPRYRRARELAGLALAQAARRLGWDTQALEEHESDHPTAARYPLSAAEKRTMADLYGCSVEWLLGADPVLSDDVRRLLRDGGMQPAEIDRLSELLRSMPGKEAK